MNEQSEWQEERNQFGGVRRFRMVNGVKEYEMIVNVDGMDMPQSEVEAYNRRKAAAKAEQRMEEQAQPKGSCPFKVFQGGMHTRCDPDCAFFEGTVCALASKPGTRETQGKRCPIGRACKEDCALFNQGCTLFSRILGL